MTDLSGIAEQMKRGPGRPRKDRPARQPMRKALRVDGWRERRTDRDISGEDQFFIPPDMIPAGMDWQWKRYTYVGKDDINHQMRLERDGAWDPVPNKMWPEKLGKWAADPDSAIISDGMILMQRPMEYTREALREEKLKATSRVSEHFNSLGLGEGPVPRAKPQITVDYGTQLVPDDDVPDLES